MRFNMTIRSMLLVGCYLSADTVTNVDAFSPRSITRLRSAKNGGASSLTSPADFAIVHKSEHLREPQSSATTTQLSLFWRKDKGDDDDDKTEKTSNGEGGFLNRLGLGESKPAATAAKEEQGDVVGGDKNTDSAAAATAVATLEKPMEAAAESGSSPSSPSPSPPSPQDEAKRLRADAEKARLQAERMEAELTLAKITRLEKKLADAKKKDSADLSNLEREMDMLQKRLRGEPLTPPPPPSPPKEPSKKDADSGPAASAEIKKANAAAVADLYPKELEKKTAAQPKAKLMNPEELKEMKQAIDESPDFMKLLLARMTQTDYFNIQSVNTTKIVNNLNELPQDRAAAMNMDFSKEEIAERKRQFREDPSYKQFYNVIQPEDEDEFALETLRMEAAFANFSEAGDFSGNLTDLDDYIAFDNEKLGSVIEVLNSLDESVVDNLIDSLYPKCTRKEGDCPTMAEVERLANDILPKTPFSPSSKPEPVLGGYIIRGVSKSEEGDEVIDAIDRELERSPLKDKMTVLYTHDFTVLGEDEMTSVAYGEGEARLLYVIGTDITRERRRVLLTGTTMMGIFTCWYLSIFPFLFNKGIGSKVDEQLALVDAGMTPDLSWLTDLSVPLFVVFVGLQLLHETAHRVVAAFNNIELSIPTLVPSIITGITSAVTQFKSIPKNREAVFDVSIAGPFVGLAASIAAVVVGSQLTLVSDPATLPALPLDILRQSTLGGGIIDSVLGGGALSVPEGALGSQAISGMTIPLHPVAVAGFISLMVNALALLPVGSTDGGRIAVSLFGRPAKAGIGTLFLLALFLVGIQGSDLFLFYFAFVAAFQSGNDIPARNEVSEVGFSRVLVATSAYVVGLLALIPFQ